MKSIVDPSALVIDLGAQKRPTVISVVGAGGKTSLLFWLAELLQASGRRVLITTTTHMCMPTSHWPVVFCRDPAMLPHASLTSPISFCFHSWKANQGKVQGFTPEAIDALVQRPNVTNMRQALLMGDHYSVEIENAEIILDIDTPDDFITAKERYTEI